MIVGGEYTIFELKLYLGFLMNLNLKREYVLSEKVST